MISLRFIGGNDTIVEGQDSDTWSFFQAVNLVKDWGYDGFRLWTKLPGIDEGYLQVNDDVLAEAIAKHNIVNKVEGHIWVEHEVEDMMRKVLSPTVEQFNEGSDDGTSSDDEVRGIRFDDSEEE